MRIRLFKLIRLSVAMMIVATSFTMPRGNAAEADSAAPAGMPLLGKWMLRSDGFPANWLGQPYHGKELREPINIIIIDNASATAEEAINRLMNACIRAGYPSRIGHSGGYMASIGGELHGQLPSQANHAFSNAFFGFNNNHGRIFGPCRLGDEIYFTGAFSREVIDLFADVKHRYSSFIAARDDFGERLSRFGGYRSAGMVDMNNALPSDSDLTTGDHDGLALVLATQK